MLESLSKNYLLRQGFNYGTIIVIQSIYLLSNIIMTTNDPFNTFVQNAFIVKVVPMMVLALLSLNLLFNTGLMVLEVNFGQFLLKGKLILKRLLSEESSQA